jgi:arylsulfatase A-like enzyme
MRLNIILFIVTLVMAGCVESPEKPNILLIITDDQGYGDLGINGNPHLKTPVLDKLAGESIVFDNFYVTPVCATTRASLMTGRYSLRTGVRDTYNGGAIMATGEITLAELLRQADYKTGIFGKWHLGDNYPSRPKDQGFDESVIHLAGGMGQVGDITTYFRGDSSYFDPVLWRNGQQEAYKGYCTDIFTEEAISFIEANRETPFFCYLSYNAPHTPLQVPDSYYQIYKGIDPASGFENDDRPFVPMSEKDKEDARKVYAMVHNIDDNLGKVFEKLDELEITDNTLIIFLTDNGPQQTRYVAGMRGRKGTVFNGGVRVPLYMKHPKLWENSKTISNSTAVIDLLPTIAALCNLQLPDNRVIDGQNLLPLISNQPVSWADRSLFFYWSRRYPELYNNIAIQAGDFKLVGNTNYNASIGNLNCSTLQKTHMNKITS